MKRAANVILATVVVVAEVASVGLAATSASAQESTARQVSRQQRLILKQQRQIEENQRRLDAQQQRLARQEAPAYGSPAPQNINRGIFGNIGNCPVGWTYSLFSGCLPAVVVIH